MSPNMAVVSGWRNKICVSVSVSVSMQDVLKRGFGFGTVSVLLPLCYMDANNMMIDVA